MARYSAKQKAALDALMKDEVYTNAMAIITDEGLGSLTMERLATEVGVSRATLYNYFDDRDAVVDYIEERTFAPVETAIQEIAHSELDPDDKLTRIVHWILAALYEDRALVVALVSMKLSGARLECKHRRRQSVLEVIEAVVAEGISAGVFKELDPRIASETVLGTIAGIVESMAYSGDFLPAEEIVPTISEILLGGLRSHS